MWAGLIQTTWKGRFINTLQVLSPNSSVSDPLPTFKSTAEQSVTVLHAWGQMLRPLLTTQPVLHIYLTRYSIQLYGLMGYFHKDLHWEIFTSGHLLNTSPLILCRVFFFSKKESCQYNIELPGVKVGQIRSSQEKKKNVIITLRWNNYITEWKFLIEKKLMYARATLTAKRLDIYRTDHHCSFYGGFGACKLPKLLPLSLLT